MPTSKKRLNITLPKHLAIFLQQISLRDDVPQATKAIELIEKALEIEEDRYFSHRAEQRDTANATFVSHEEAWS